MNKVLSDERLGAGLRVTENRCVLFDSFTYIYIYIYIYSCPYHLTEHPLQQLKLLNFALHKLDYIVYKRW